MVRSVAHLLQKLTNIGLCTPPPVNKMTSLAPTQRRAKLINTPTQRVKVAKKTNMPLSNPHRLQSFVDAKVDSYVWSHTLCHKRTTATSDKEVLFHRTRNSSYNEIKKYVLTPCEIGIQEQAEKVGIQCHPLHPHLFDELCLRSKRWWVNKSMFTTEKPLHVHCFIPGLPAGKRRLGITGTPPVLWLGSPSAMPYRP